jgi:hypothetical protein
MDENIIKCMSLISVTFFLLCAVTLFFILYRGSSNTVRLVNREINDRGALYQATAQDDYSAVVKGSEIACFIRNGPEMDVYIDSVFIPQSIDISSFDYSLIDRETLYTLKYRFDGNGEIKAIDFRKKH